MKLSNAIKLAKQLVAEHLGNTWTVKSNTRKTSGGLCRYDEQVIELSSYWMTIITDESVLDIILHEIAHGLAPREESHGEIWRNIAISIGGSGNETMTDEQLDIKLYEVRVVKDEAVKEKRTIKAAEKRKAWLEGCDKWVETFDSSGGRYFTSYDEYGNYYEREPLEREEIAA